jgi:hypothetical protein
LRRRRSKPASARAAERLRRARRATCGRSGEGLLGLGNSLGLVCEIFVERT